MEKKETTNKPVEYTIEFRWGVSRGEDTYGYNLCSLYVDGKKVAMTSGGGYDMKGAAFAMWMRKTFIGEIMKLEGNTGSNDKPGGYYGLSFGRPKKDGSGWQSHKRYQEGDEISLDGACGMGSMERILGAIGWEYRKLRTKGEVYILARK